MRRSSPGSGSVSGLSPDSGFSASIIVLAQQIPGMPRDARAAALDVVEEKRLLLKLKGEYFCCVGLRGRHNSLTGVDGLFKSRKFAIDVQAGAPV